MGNHRDDHENRQLPWVVKPETFWLLDFYSFVENTIRESLILLRYFLYQVGSGRHKVKEVIG